MSKPLQALNFQNSDLLKIEVNLDIQQLANRIVEITKILLNGSVLNIKSFQYNITEIEYYVNSKKFPDIYTFRHPIQKEFGCWYFHRAGNPANNPNTNPKEGRIKGVDLALGNGTDFIGVLIRGVERLTDGTLITGPSLFVDEILSHHNVKKVKDLIEGNVDMYLSEYSSLLKPIQFEKSPRTGLNLKRGFPEDLCQVYISAPLNFKLNRELEYMAPKKKMNEAPSSDPMYSDFLMGALIAYSRMINRVGPADKEKLREYFSKNGAYHLSLFHETITPIIAKHLNLEIDTHDGRTIDVESLTECFITLRELINVILDVWKRVPRDLAERFVYEDSNLQNVLRSYLGFSHLVEIFIKQDSSRKNSVMNKSGPKENEGNIKSKEPMEGRCPECDSNKIQIEWDVTQEKIEGDPWSEIKEVAICGKCRSVIPHYLWHRPDGMKPEVAKEIWQTVYRDEPSGMEEQRDEFFKDEEAKGDPLKLLQREAVKLLQAGEMRKLVAICNKGIKDSGDNPIILEFIKLRGIGYAEQGILLEAKRDFLKVLELLPNDGATLSNYLAASFSSGDKESAIKGIKLFYSGLDDEMKNHVVENVIEALKVDQVRVEELPEEILDAVTAKLGKIKTAI